MEPAAPPIDRPPPGHYMDRLSTVLDALPAGEPRPWARRQQERAPRRVVIRSRRRHSGQLALPLESVRG